MDEKSRLDDWLRRRDGAGKRKTRADGGLTRRQQKRQPHVEREERRDEMEAYQERYKLWYEKNRKLMNEFWEAYGVRKNSLEAYARFESLQDSIMEANPPVPPDRGEYYRGVQGFSARNYQRLKDVYPGDYGELIRYLRLDPYQFRSGYIKGDCCRILKRTVLSEEEIETLRQVVLAVVASPYGRQEFKEYARLAAAKLDSPSFRDRLRQLGGWKAEQVLTRLEQADRMRASREAKETPS